MSFQTINNLTYLSGTQEDYDNLADTSKYSYTGKYQNNNVATDIIEKDAYNALTKKDSMGVKSGSMVLYKDSVNSSKAINYRLKMWISDQWIPERHLALGLHFDLSFL